MGIGLHLWCGNPAGHRSRQSDRQMGCTELYGGVHSGFCVNLSWSLVLDSVSTPLPQRKSLPKDTHCNRFGVGFVLGLDQYEHTVRPPSYDLMILKIRPH